jgi:RNA polymerase sigma-70 factor (ECF subfamily)
MAHGSDPWTVWLEAHGAALVLLARQWVGSQADAEDVVQEAFVRCWRSRERVEDPIAYLYASVRRCALDWLRARGRQQRREAAVACPESEPMLTSPAEAEERRVAIEAALRQLPESQAEVVVMKIWGGLTLPQIAAALDVSANTVSSRYRYALAKLREHLVEEPIG